MTKEKEKQKCRNAVIVRVYTPRGGSLPQGFNLTGFTLAELLITLAIVGIVAAISLPTLFSNITDRRLETQAKKAAAVLVNGYRLMLANQGGSLRIADLPLITNCNNFDDENCVSVEHKTAFKILTDSAGGLDLDTLPENYAITDSDQLSPFKWTDVKYAFMTGDGAVYGLIANENTSTIDIVVDVNNTSNPNTVQKDLRKFRVSGDGTKVADVSSELAAADKGECSIENPGGCLTAEECWALNPPQPHEMKWDGTSCSVCADSQCSCVYVDGVYDPDNPNNNPNKCD